MPKIARFSAWMATLACLLCLAAPTPAPAADVPAFPGAQGWAANTPGGRGGQILRVTTLAADGPGSLAEAVNTPGPRIVVFEVGGVIDLGVQTLRITEPYLTIAGQTAPAPGITLIRGGVDIATHDVIVRHIRVRPGSTGDGAKFHELGTGPHHTHDLHPVSQPHPPAPGPLRPGGCDRFGAMRRPDLTVFTPWYPSVGNPVLGNFVAEWSR